MANALQPENRLHSVRALLCRALHARTEELELPTIGLMLSDDHFGRGLCWDTRRLFSGDLLWGHDGADPGIATYMGFRPRDRVGVIMFYNYARPRGEALLLERLFSEGENAA